MFKSYQDIFNQRGKLYHQGMLEFPLARQEEFKHIIQLADLQDDQIVCDIPSGGSYLKNFIDKSVKLISIETSQQFLNAISEDHHLLYTENINNILLKSHSIDRIISLAGLHHVESREKFYQECDRLLKPNGILCLADGFENSKVAQFLNEFVNQYNSMGHQGIFLNNQDLISLKNVGFNLVFSENINYYWSFKNISDMVEFCKLLFGIDQANEQTILEGIKQYLGYNIVNNQCKMNWQLYFIKAIKVDENN
jgi:cyclopropane fatty-acyl-phospholipid synthase-like methyltransferase